MATGISMSSVNKIKELAENGEYGLALDILENQDLSKSLSPQFIRVCGEVYYENHKYHEARAALVRAHSMAPAGNKIIFSLIQLYLTMGLRTLADKYYEVYKFNLEGREDAGEIRLEYLFAKADRKPVQELRAMLAAANDNEKAERWEYEHLLILAALKEQEKLKYEGEVFKATYKKSIYIDDVNELLAGTADPEKKLYCFPENETADDAAEDADTRKMEEKALEADDYRLNPTAPTITLMVENDEPVSGTMKIKQTLARNKAKREEKKEKKKLAKAEAESNVQNTEGENSETASEKHEKRGFFKRRMSKQEEEEIMEALAGIKESNDDNTTLLNKIMDEEAAQTENNEAGEDTGKTVEKPETPQITEAEVAEKAEDPKEIETSEEPKVSEAGESGETGKAAETDKTDSDETEQHVEIQKAEAQAVDSSEENTDTAQTEAQDAISKKNTDTVQAEAKDADIDEGTEKAAEVGASEADRVAAAPTRKSIVLESVKIKPDISDIKITTMSGDDYTSDNFDPMFDENDLDDQINSIIESEINGDRDSLVYNDVVREVEQQEMERKRKRDERVSSDMGLDKDRDSMISNMELTEDSMSYKANASADSSDSKAVSPEYVTDNTKLYGVEATAEGSETHTADVEGKIDSETVTDKDNIDSKENTETNNKSNDSDDETEKFDFISVDEDDEVSFAENADEDDMVTIDHSQLTDSMEEVEIEDLSKSEDVKLVDLMDTLTDVSEVSVDIVEETSEPETSEPETSELEISETKTSGLEVDEEKTESEESKQSEQLETEVIVEAETDRETTPIVETEPGTETFESVVETEVEEATTEGKTEEVTAETEVKPVETTETETIEMAEAETEEAVEAETATEVEPETVTEAEGDIEPETVAEAAPEAEPEEITTPDELDQMLREIEMISRENEKIVKEYEDTARAEEAQPVEEEEPEPVKYGFQSDKLVGDEGYEFPIFRSELFPEYNSDDKIGGNKVFNPDDIKLENQEKIDEHLAKEEALLKETDELLARLGIELGTKYYSGSDYFTKEQFEEDHEAVKRMDASINQKQDKKTKEDNSRFKLR